MSNALPPGQSLLVRTDFSNESTWQQVSTDVQAEQRLPDGARAQGFFTVVDNRAYERTTPEDLLALASAPVSYMFIVDELTITRPEHPVLVVRPGRTGSAEDEAIVSFRAVPRELASIENNLSIGNLDFSDYQPHLDNEGIYRGLPTPPRQRFVGIVELVEAAATNVSTTALARFHQTLIKNSATRQHQVTEVGDVRELHDGVRANDYSKVHELLGRDELLDVTEAGGPALTLHLNVTRGYWSAVLDPQTLVPRAAMLVQGALPDPEPRTTVATVRSWHTEGRFGVLDAPDLPGGCWVFFHCIVDVYGTSNFELREGQQVEVDFVASTSAGIPNPFRAVEVRLQS
ncbi:DUF6924 domain-containing protein [Rhodococcoides kyotonense]|uniref:DUF6924 domain-containing protein n=1 Tax=Rhodococcoides kyotonense TaxID=398843 RepID=A0A239N6A3_9NOCA|nr:hypothetical protein [Rhodococcus kyotonensis]SNT50260.1 hypothetical protein SAMN05421642_13019 [Rhodococcus kyotonensis]